MHTCGHDGHTVMLFSVGEGTVDTVHPNDLGMLRQAAVFTDFIARLINKGNI